MPDRTRPPLKLIQGGREAIERQLLHLCIYGSPEELGATIDALKPRGRLRLVKLSDEQSPSPPLTRDLQLDEHSRE